MELKIPSKSSRMSSSFVSDMLSEEWTIFSFRSKSISVKFDGKDLSEILEWTILWWPSLTVSHSNHDIIYYA